MARAHTCFVQAQEIPWVDGAPGNPDVAVQSKVLSQDDETGAFTAILKVEPGFTRSGPVHFRCDVEIFVLDGELEVNGEQYTKDCYAFWPSGYVRNSTTSEQGCVLLALFDGLHQPTLGAAPEEHFRDDKLIKKLNAYEMDWKTGEAGSVTGKPLSPTIFTKKLRVDTDTREQTFLYAALPHHAPPPIMKGKFGHPMIEEVFVLSGEYVFGDVGKMGPGGYAWWRENEMHGPAGSEIGYNLFIRIYDGPLKNKFLEEESQFSFRPPHNPALPDHLEDFDKPYPFTDPW
ncbi:MAG: cupin domain-containing protein [Rhodospirillaceae bacterium]|nr:cupin domain-containing protein [Rhodospirillaceae bacterium]